MIRIAGHTFCVEDGSGFKCNHVTKEMVLVKQLLGENELNEERLVVSTYL